MYSVCTSRDIFFFSVLLVLLPHLLEAAPACQSPIRYCQHCHYNKNSNCRSERSLQGVSVSQQEAQCLAILQNDPTLYAVVYSSGELDKCFAYTCNETQALTYEDDKPYVTYMRTCDAGIKTFILAHLSTKCSE